MLGKKESIMRFVAFDIGTASVSAALFEYDIGTRSATIKKIYRKFHAVSSQDDQKAFTKATTQRMSAILDTIRTEEKVLPTHYIIGLSSIFYLGKTEHIYDHFQKPKTFSQSDIDGYIEKGRKKFISDLQRDDMVIFETVLMEALLNGYELTQPAGKTAEEIEIIARFAATSAELHTAFEDTIRAFLKDASITFATFPVSVWLLMQDIVRSKKSTILVDVGGELTDVSFLTDGIIHDTLSLPFGVSNILIRISESEHIDPENALSVLRSYTARLLDPEAETRIRGIIRKEMKSWEDFFERAWQKANRLMMTDIHMFFLGGGGLLEEVKSAVAPPLLHPDLAHNLEVKTIAPDAFAEKLQFSNMLDGPGDFGLASLMINAYMLINVSKK